MCNLEETMVMLIQLKNQHSNQNCHLVPRIFLVRTHQMQVPQAPYNCNIS
ncbi:hypothetical protein DAI22_10g102000 [Oryza sativa Japonica Group]|nr:hypothetical protein DAI22_10g102000 [Oryza sativa Japonica Group]